MKEALTKEEKNLVDRLLEKEREKLEKDIIDRRLSPEEEQIVKDLIFSISIVTDLDLKWKLFSISSIDICFLTSIKHSLGEDTDGNECSVKFEIKLYIPRIGSGLPYYAVYSLPSGKSNGIKNEILKCLQVFGNYKSSDSESKTFAQNALIHIKGMYAFLDSFDEFYKKFKDVSALVERSNKINIINDKFMRSLNRIFTEKNKKK